MSPFNEDRDDVIVRAREAGVTSIVSVGIDLDSSRQAICLAETYAGVKATVGYHPHSVAQVTEADVTGLTPLAGHPAVVAIGEIGLDFYRNYSPREAQLRVFVWQLELAVSLDLPVVVHSRQAEREIISRLQAWTSRHQDWRRRPRGVIHCFNGDWAAARRYLEMGFFISLGAYIGYPASSKMYDVIRRIPPDKLVVETDSPFLPPQSQRGRRNEPSYLPQVVAVLAKIRRVSPETVAAEITHNAHRLFRLADA
jgi:TatD DNase family protein